MKHFFSLLFFALFAFANIAHATGPPSGGDVASRLTNDTGVGFGNIVGELPWASEVALTPVEIVDKSIITDDPTPTDFIFSEKSIIIDEGAGSLYDDGNAWANDTKWLRSTVYYGESWMATWQTCKVSEDTFGDGGSEGITKTGGHANMWQLEYG